jgi:hypothetical protein
VFSEQGHRAVAEFEPFTNSRWQGMLADAGQSTGDLDEQDDAERPKQDGPKRLVRTRSAGLSSNPPMLVMIPRPIFKNFFNSAAVRIGS